MPVNIFRSLSVTALQPFGQGRRLLDPELQNRRVPAPLGLTTATCYATLALRAAGWKSSSAELQKASSWFCDMVSAEGSVGHTKLDSAPVLVCTALTLRTLATLDHTKYATKIDSLLGWLARAQNTDGGFGESLGSPSTIHHTAEAVIAIGAASVASSTSRERLRQAGKYLEGKRALGQNRHKDIAYITSAGREVMLPHTYQSDGLLLQAELALDAAGLHHRSIETAKFLIHHQQDGYWAHDAVPGKVPSWGIMESVVGLNQFLDSAAQTSGDSSAAGLQAGVDVPAGILAIGTEWASGHGGLSTFNRELCTTLARQGERVVCVVPTATAQEVKEAAETGVLLVGITNSPHPVSTDLLYRRATLPDGFYPRIVIGHGRITGPYAASQVTDNFRQSRRIHFIHMVADEIEWHKGKADAAVVADVRSREELGLCQGAQLVAAVGPHLFEEAATLVYGVQPPVRVHRFDPGLHDLPAPNEPPPAIQCLVLGRTEDTKLKGLDIAAAAVASLPHPYPRPFTSEPVLFVRGAPPGTGTELQKQLLAIAKKPINIRVREYSSSADQILEDLRRASVVLMPSRTEGFGLVALEALALRRPILVSDRSGFGKLIIEKLGTADSANFVVRTTGDLDTDAEEWGQALESTLRDREAAFGRSRKLHDILAPLMSWEVAVSELLTAFGS